VGSSELSWISFLGDAESSGTLAVLKDKCLELSDLSIAKKCQNDHFHLRHISSRLPTLGELLDGLVLETSVL
jgi:membrane-bound lytic murein transglycosylase MltF